jgi:hypothetical protein
MTLDAFDLGGQVFRERRPQKRTKGTKEETYLDRINSVAFCADLQYRWIKKRGAADQT